MMRLNPRMYNEEGGGGGGGGVDTIRLWGFSECFPRR